MPNEQLDLAVIIGSVRQGRFGPVVARWLLGEVERHGRFDPNVVDLADTLPPLVLEDAVPADLENVTKQLETADAFVVVTPEYNHSFPASLKSLIDWHFTEWRTKPVGFVSYGGHAGGLRAVEQLRLVFAEMHAVTIRDTVSFPMFWDLFDHDGELVDAEGPNAAARTLLDQLAWWAAALQEARLKKPYEVDA